MNILNTPYPNNINTIPNRTVQSMCIYPNSPCFKSNPNSPKLGLKLTDFFVRVSGYSKNNDWAYQVKKITNNAVKLMKTKDSSDDILPVIAKQMKDANGFVNDHSLRTHTGVLRACRKNYGECGEWGDIYTPYSSTNKYSQYKTKLDKRIKEPLTNPYFNCDFLTRIEKSNDPKINKMAHGNYGYTNAALDYVNNIYKDLHEKYITKPQNVTKETLSDINPKVAEIRWILAHSTPWERGSDSISNSFTRALYKSMGIKCPPLKKDVTLDLEAYCTELSDYKKNFPNYFEKAPEVID